MPNGSMSARMLHEADPGLPSCAGPDPRIDPFGRPDDVEAPRRVGPRVKPAGDDPPIRE
jgi:hypothetical protein